MSDAQLVIIVGAQLLTLLGMVYYLSRQTTAAEQRQMTERHESERRLAEEARASEQRLAEVEQRLIGEVKASEQRLTGEIKTVEQRLAEQYRETNRDTKTLIREVGVLQGYMKVTRHDRESEPSATAEAAD